MMSKRAGFTMLEVIISATILTTIVGLSLGIMATTTDHVADGTIRHDLRARASDAATVIQRELRTSSRGHLVLSNAYAFGAGRFTRASYRSVTGFNPSTNVVELDPTAASGLRHDVRFELYPGETANGADDDGDGLIDEGRLVLFRGGGRVATVAESVDGTSVEFVLCSGTVEQPTVVSPGSTSTHLLVRFTLQQRGRQLGVLERHAHEVSVGLRN